MNTYTSHVALDVDVFCFVLRSVMGETQRRPFLDRRLSYLNNSGRLFLKQAYECNYFHLLFVLNVVSKIIFI
jgi:hypothetical protein